MGLKRLCHGAAALCWIVASLIVFRRQLGHGVFPEDEHSAELGPVALFFFLYGIIALMAGAIAELRERITRMERLLQASSVEPHGTRHRSSEKLPEPK